MRAILTYHAIDDAPTPIAISLAVLARQLDELGASGVRILTLDELCRAPRDEPAVALTFDDALVDFGEHAWPALAARGLPVTLFVPTDHVGGVNDWEAGPVRGVPRYTLMGWDEIARLAEAGVEIGSHGRRHRDLRGLSPNELTDEVEGSAARLERRLGARPRSFAYPYGGVDRAAAGAVATAYRVACTTELRPVADEDPAHLLPRLDAHYFRSPGSLVGFGGRGFTTRLALRRAARAARTRLTRSGRV